MNQMPLGFLFNLAAPFTHTVIRVEFTTFSESNEKVINVSIVQIYSVGSWWCLCFFFAISLFFNVHQ